MSESREMSDEALGRAVAALASEVAFPRTPPIAPAVVSHLRAEREARTHPPFPSMALWSRRRALVLVAVGLAAVLAVAFAARLVIGAAEIRIQPGGRPSASPLVPGGLGTPVPVAEVGDAVRFEVELPAGTLPDEAYVFRTTAADRAVLFAWRAEESEPALPGTPWRQMLIEIRGDQQTLVKDVGRFEDATIVSVAGRDAFWIETPHELIIRTAGGVETFSISANVLIWEEAGITYRLETSLDQAAAIELAETVN